MYPFPHSPDFYGTNSTSYDDVLPSHFPSTTLPPPHFLVSDHLDSSMNLFLGHSSSTSGCSSYGSPSYETSPVIRVCSTGDLHGINMGRDHRLGSPLASESSIIIEGMNRASPYSPEVKKERIERYRAKRTQRNFNKKIKYACRKTLADSRPRIRGRFARNEEIEKTPQVQWNNVGGEEDDEDDDPWINYLDSVSPGNLFS